MHLPPRICRVVGLRGSSRATHRSSSYSGRAAFQSDPLQKSSQFPETRPARAGDPSPSAHGSGTDAWVSANAAASGNGQGESAIVREFPVDAPRLRVVIKHDAPEDVQNVSALHWEIKDDGTWARTVSSIGVASNIGSVATTHSHAILLDCPCANCSEPITVTTGPGPTRSAGRTSTRRLPPAFAGTARRQSGKREETERQQRAAEQWRIEREREQQKAEGLQRLVVQAVEAEEGKTEPTGSSLPTDRPFPTLGSPSP